MKHLEFLTREHQITTVKSVFEQELKHVMHLHRVSAPLSVYQNTGINDDLNGIERVVSFPVKAQSDKQAVVVNSLAKWKRIRLAEFEIPKEEGIITDMRAIRPDEDYSPIHSIYVDQWDWEKVIDPSERTIEKLKTEIGKIYSVLRITESRIEQEYQIPAILPEEITFIHTEDLLVQYPHLSAKEREHEACKQYGAIALIGIGGELADGSIHDGRAPDYDDWTSESKPGYKGLNADILVWHPILKTSFELSSMGIRVDPKILTQQLAIRKCPERADYPFHSALLQGKLPQTIGGGIGQSRVCMFMLKKAHIGEVQVSLWPEDKVKEMLDQGVALL